LRSFNISFEEFCSIWDQLADDYNNSLVVGVGIKDVVKIAVEMASNWQCVSPQARLCPISILTKNKSCSQAAC